MNAIETSKAKLSSGGSKKPQRGAVFCECFCVSKLKHHLTCRTSSNYHSSLQTHVQDPEKDGEAFGRILIGWVCCSSIRTVNTARRRCFPRQQDLSNATRRRDRALPPTSCFRCGNGSGATASASLSVGQGALWRRTSLSESWLRLGGQHQLYRT